MKTTSFFALVLGGAMSCCASLAANTRPEIEPIAPVETSVDTPVEGIPIHIRDAESPPEALVVGATSLSTTLVPNAGLRVTGTGSTRWLSVRPALGASGQAPIVVQVRDPEGGFRETEFLLIVDASPVSLKIQPVAPQRGWQSGPALRVPIYFQWGTMADSNLRVTATVSPASVLGSGSNVAWMAAADTRNRVLGLEMPRDRSGGCWVTVTGELNGGRARATEAFPLLVQPAPLLPDAPYALGAAFVRQPRAVIDWDGRGGMDFVVAGSRVVQVWTEKAPGYALAASAPFEALPLEVDTVDFDGDGLMDVVARGTFQVGLWRATETQGVVVLERVPLTPGYREGAVRGMLWRDWDGDGDVDVLLFRGTGTEMLRQEDGEWLWSAVSGTGMGWPAAAADADGDGDPDLIASTPTSPTGMFSVHGGIWWNDGRGRFATNGPPLVTSTIQAVGWQDLDGDAEPEPWFLVQEQRTNRVVVTFIRSLGGWRESGRMATLATDGTHLGWGDLDVDGIPDLAMPVATFGAGSPPQGATGLDGWAVRWARGDGEGGFETLGEHRAPSSVSTNAISMVPNAQSGLDVAIGRDFFRNRLPNPNLAPGRPSGLQAWVSGKRVRLSWQAPWDMHQPSGLTYNVRVGTSPGGNDLVPSMAAADGRLRRVGPGNAGGNRFLELDLSRVARGTVHWSVQAVDASYAGGAFADEEMLLGFPSGTESEIRLTLEPRWTGSFFSPVISGFRYPPRLVLIESSADLVEWTPVQWIQPEPDGRFFEVLTVGPPVTAKRGFYRARTED